MHLIQSLNTNDDNDGNNGRESNNRVEIATIHLPASMFIANLSDNLGNNFHYATSGQTHDLEGAILRARSETVENIIESNLPLLGQSDTTNFEKTAAPSDAEPSGAVSSFAVSTEIQAVVDLKQLSELAGCEDLDEFVEGLYRDMEENKESEDSIFSADEEADLLSISSPTRVVEDLTVLAAPFVDILRESAPVPDDSRTFLSDFIEASTIGTKDHEDNYHNVAHEAFLLDIPLQQDGIEPKHHHFLLALPEIQLDHEDTVSESSEQFSLLERAFSILPSDVQEINFEATTTTVPLESATHYQNEMEEGNAATAEIHLDLIVKRSVPIIGYIILVTGLLALASVGAALDMQKGGVSPSLKTFWRLNATSVVLLPMAIVSFKHEGLPKLSSQQIVLFPICAAAYAFMTGAFVIALDMTSLADAFVLSNMTCIVIIAGKALLGYAILPAEGFGAIIGFVGAAICAKDQEQDSTSLSADFDYETPKNPMLGNIVAFLSCFGTATYLIIAKTLRPSVNLFVFMFFVMSLASVFVYLYMVLSGEMVTFSLHPVHGLFGWAYLQWDRLPLEMYMAIICNVVGTAGYVAVMKYFDPVVVSTVMLMEPVIAAFMAVITGVDPLPGMQTWIGDIVVTLGSVLVIYSGSKKVESIDATEVLKPPTGVKAAHMHTPIIVKSPIKLNENRKELYGSIGSSIPIKNPSDKNVSHMITKSYLSE